MWSALGGVRRGGGKESGQTITRYLGDSCKHRLDLCVYWFKRADSVFSLLTYSSSQ